MNILLNFIFFVLIPGAGWAQTDFQQYTILIDSATYEYSLERFMGTDPFSIESFERDRRLYSNYDEFLRYLESRDSNYFRNNVLLHSTGSIQYASPSSPRVLTFGNGSVLSFSENNKNLEKRVELIQFNKSTLKFEMGEIVFADDIQFHKNPRSCVACHTENSRPIWEPYDLWPKAYFSTADTLGSEKEKELLLEYLRQPKLGIHKYLKNKISTESLNNFVFNNNASYTMFITGLMYARDMNILAQHKNRLEPLKYALTAVMNYCTTTVQREYVPLKEYLGDQLYDSARVNHEHFSSDTKSARQDFIDYIAKFYSRLFPGYQIYTERTERLAFETDIIQDLRFLLENSGIAWRQFTTNHGDNAYAMAVPSNFPLDFSGYLVIFDKGLFQELKPTTFDTNITLTWPKFDCEKLKQKSLKAVSKFSWDPSLAIKTDRKNLDHGLSAVGKCIQCHSVQNDRGNTPFIPFDDTEAFRTWLQIDENFETIKHKIESGKMPKRTTITPLEKESVLEVIDFLRSHGPQMYP